MKTPSYEALMTAVEALDELRAAVNFTDDGEVDDFVRTETERRKLKEVREYLNALAYAPRKLS